MAERTSIEWADSTLNFWEGCQETGSPACVACYARERNLRYAPKGTTVAPNWGPHAPRREIKSWRSTLNKISRDAMAAFAAGRTEPWLVFVNSLSDFFDNQADAKLRADALLAMSLHPHLTFMVLTKRPQNILKMVRAIYGPEVELQDVWPSNIAIGCTVVTQAEADRDLPYLLLAAAILIPAFTFVSMEPLAGWVDLTSVNTMRFPGAELLNALTGELRGLFGDSCATRLPALDWVIAGGATDQGKHKAFHTDPDAFRGLRDQCAAAGVPFFMKQMTKKAPIPADLLIREKPRAA